MSTRDHILKLSQDSRQITKTETYTLPSYNLSFNKYIYIHIYTIRLHGSTV